MRISEARRLQVGRDERLDPFRWDPPDAWELEPDYCDCEACFPPLEELVDELCLVASLTASLHRPFAGKFSSP